MRLIELGLKPNQISKEAFQNWWWKWNNKLYIMSKTVSDSEFSIVRGGLLDRFLILTGVLKVGQNSTLRKIIFYISITWIPLLALSAYEGLLWGSSIDLPFLKEFATHIRLLVAVPLFVLAEVVVDSHVNNSLGQFYRSGLLTENTRLKFEAAKQKADRMSNSYLAETIILVIILANVLFRISTNTFDLTLWMFPEKSDPSALSYAGYWAAFISFPVFQFLIFRWFWRWLIWQRLLSMISNIGLRIVPQHPDKSGGLGFLGESPLPFSIFTFALSIIFSAMLAERVLFQNFNLQEHYALIGTFVVICLLINVVPLLTFIKPLSAARSKGINDYHALVAEHHLNFENKWITNRKENSDEILGSPDASSSADIQMVYESVKDMSIFPFNIKTMLITVVIALLPLLLVFALQIPVVEILKMLAGLLL